MEYEIKFFGWAYNPSQNHDKIWGWVKVGEKIYNFWGKRADLGESKSLKFKAHNASENELDKLTRKKTSQNRDTPYAAIPLTKSENGSYIDIEKVYPDFDKSFRKQLFKSVISGKVK